MEEARHKVCLALGTNLGDRVANLQKARDELSKYMRITAVSPVYETAPAYVVDQPKFLNAVLIGKTSLSPQALLFTVKEIERIVGRKPTFRFGPRVIDIDIIFYDDIILSTPELSIPHTSVAERIFVLKPLSDIAPEWINPTNNKSVSEMLNELQWKEGDLIRINETL